MSVKVTFQLKTRGPNLSLEREWSGNFEKKMEE